MTRKTDAIPLGAWPRAMSEDIAAAYCSLSVGSFRSCMAAESDRAVPVPVWLTKKRKVYYREDIDAWLDARAGRATMEAQGHGWGSTRDARNRLELS